MNSLYELQASLTMAEAPNNKEIKTIQFQAMLCKIEKKDEIDLTYGQYISYFSAGCVVCF